MSCTELRTTFGKRKKCNKIGPKTKKKVVRGKILGIKPSSRFWQTVVICRGMYRLALKNKKFNRTQLNSVNPVDSWEIEFLKSWAVICFKHLMTGQSLKASRTKKGTTDQNNYQHFLKTTDGHSHMHKNTHAFALAICQ